MSLHQAFIFLLIGVEEVLNGIKRILKIVSRIFEVKEMASEKTVGGGEYQ